MALRFLKVGSWEGYYEDSYPELAECPGKVEELVNKNKVRVFNSKPNLVAEMNLTLGGENKRVVVKIFGWRNILHFLISPFMKSKAQLSLENSLHLIRTGLPTPKPIAAFWERKGGFVKRNFFITESLGECESLREILKRRRKDGLEKTLYIKKLADYVRKMHDSGLFHKDLTLANFLLRPGDDSFYLVDLNRARRKKRLSFFQRVEDIVRMDLTNGERDKFIDFYTGGRNSNIWKRIIKIRRKIKNFGEKIKRRRKRIKSILSFR
jgi:tRNA A-37 threonylcarbamoyl transferase component Bud32